MSKLCAEDVPHPALRSHVTELVPSWAADPLDDGVVGHGASVGDGLARVTLNTGGDDGR